MEPPEALGDLSSYLILFYTDQVTSSLFSFFGLLFNKINRSIFIIYVIFLVVYYNFAPNSSGFFSATGLCGGLGMSIGYTPVVQNV